MKSAKITYVLLVVILLGGAGAAAQSPAGDGTLTPLRFIVRILIAQARERARAFDYDAAIDMLNLALALQPDNPALYVERGQHVLLIYEWDRALMDYNRAIDLDPTFTAAYYRRGLLFYTQGARERALDDFAHYLKHAPEGEFAADAARYSEDIRGEFDALNP